MEKHNLISFKQFRLIQGLSTCGEFFLPSTQGNFRVSMNIKCDVLQITYILYKDQYSNSVSICGPKSSLGWDCWGVHSGWCAPSPTLFRTPGLISKILNATTYSCTSSKFKRFFAEATPTLELIVSLNSLNFSDDCFTKCRKKIIINGKCYITDQI